MRREFKSRFDVDRLWIKSQQALSVLNTIYETSADAATQLATTRYPGNSRSLADFFGVSPSAMRIRLLELSLVH